MTLASRLVTRDGDFVTFVDQRAALTALHVTFAAQQNGACNTIPPRDSRLITFVGHLASLFRRVNRISVRQSDTIGQRWFPNRSGRRRDAHGANDRELNSCKWAELASGFCHHG